MSEDSQRVLFEYARSISAPGLLVELGVCHGKTALMLAWVAWQCGFSYLGVDDWSLEGDRAEVECLIRGAGIPMAGYRFETKPIVFVAESKTQEALLPTEPISLLLIDAGHDEANVSADCERWIPLVAPGGYVAFDDYPGVSDPTHCHAAVRTHAELHTSTWEMCFYDGRMMIKRKPLTKESE